MGRPGKTAAFVAGLIIVAFVAAFGGVLAQETENKAGDAVRASDRITVYFFHLDTCPHCKQEKVFLDELTIKYPQTDIRSYEMTKPESQRLYKEMGEKLAFPASAMAIGAVPMTVIDGRFFLGYISLETTGAEIENHVRGMISGGATPEKQNPRQVSMFGQILRFDETASLAVLAVVFGLADGINPCMFSVLLLLLAYLLASSNPRKVVLSGLLFALSVFVIYYALMVGVYKSLSFFQGSFAPAMAVLKTVFGLIFVAAGLWMAKDFFFLKEGQKVSFAIPKAAHPMIKKLASRSTFAAVVGLALFSSLVELPCTFALPLGYAAILAERAVFPYPYLFLYNLLFVVPLLVIVAAVSLGFSQVKRLEIWRGKSKKIMRLVSGFLLFLLGIAFLLKIF